METVPFGYRDVAPEEKPELIRGIFSSVASRYDLMNDLMSAGVHRLWKDEFVAWLNPQPGSAILDVAGGTGDIAFRIAARLRAKGGAAKITVCDVSEAMLFELVAQAALDANRTLRVFERRSQSQDHPILLTVPETLCLKCLILEVV